jgi:hypothetical protein
MLCSSNIFLKKLTALTRRRRSSRRCLLLYTGDHHFCFLHFNNLSLPGVFRAKLMHLILRILKLGILRVSLEKNVFWDHVQISASNFFSTFDLLNTMKPFSGHANSSSNLLNQTGHPPL